MKSKLEEAYENLKLIVISNNLRWVDADVESNHEYGWYNNSGNWDKKMIRMRLYECPHENKIVISVSSESDCDVFINHFDGYKEYFKQSNWL